MNTPVYKVKSMPMASIDDHSNLKRKGKTLTRLFRINQSYQESHLKAEMKQRLPYQSDPNLLEENDEIKDPSKKIRTWKWPFPRHRIDKELPDHLVKGIRPISISSKLAYFPNMPLREPHFEPSSSHLAGSNVQEIEELVIAFQDDQLVTEIEPISDMRNPLTDSDRCEDHPCPNISPLSTKPKIIRRESSRRIKKSLSSVTRTDSFESESADYSQNQEYTNGDMIPNMNSGSKAKIVIKAWVFFLSLIVDYFYYKTSYYMKCYSMSMFLFATYYVTYTVAYKPSLLIFENLIFSSLIYLSIYFSVLFQENRNISTLIPSTIGVLISIGIFTNVSFMFTGLWLFIWPCIWVMTRNSRYKLFQLLSFINLVLVSFILTSFAISIIDSIYFKQLTISLNQQRCPKNLIPGLISSYMSSFLRIHLCVSGRFILTPYNAIQYYFDKSTAAHTTPTNALYNIFGFVTVFGPIITLFSYSSYKILCRAYSKWVALARIQKPPLLSRIYWIFKIYQFGLILNVMVIFFFNFTRAYYAPFSLAPLFLPMFLVCGYSLEYYMSKKLRYIFWTAWLMFNATLLVYYGTLHEAGVTKSLSTIQHSIIDKIKGSEDCKTSLLPCLTCTSASPCHYHIFYSHTMQPPEHFLLWPHMYRSYNFTLSWENEGNIQVLKSKIGQMKEKCTKSQCSILLVSLAPDNLGEELHLGTPLNTIFPHFGKGTIPQQFDRFMKDIIVPVKGEPQTTFNIIKGFFNYFTSNKMTILGKLNSIIATGRRAFSLRIYQA
ncbi:SMP3-like protein [Oopsacas minuta]|uniref:SMP3-like protein n=1 Tax=Oopsacas minuta TaxID=111878 RepID=A0AAV7JZJ3_9METZ|nr:SMP3-like protein [Oopsacas minuta]